MQRGRRTLRRTQNAQESGGREEADESACVAKRSPAAPPQRVLEFSEFNLKAIPEKASTSSHPLLCTRAW